MTLTSKRIEAWRRRTYRFLQQVPNLTLEQYEQARKDFAQHGIDFAHVPKGWRFWKWVENRSQIIILWVGHGLVREYLDAPETLIARLAEMERECLKNSSS